MTRDVLPASRKAMTLARKVEILERDARCPECGEPFNGKVEYDHVVSLFGGGSDEAENITPLCPACHKVKTAEDAKRHKKIRHNRGETGQRARRQKRGKGSIPQPAVSPLSKDHRHYRKQEWPKRKWT